jgi:hypothetical protein
MESLLIILGLAATVTAIIIILQKTGKIKDTDGDLIPDVVEDKVEETKQVIKEVKSRAKKVVKEVKEVVDAAKGEDKPKVKRGRKPKTVK